jgi:rubrerythrin
MEDLLKGNEQNPLNPPSDQNSEHTTPENNVEKLGYDVSGIPPEDLDSRWLRWKCLECGYLYEGVVRLKVCPKCGNQDPDKFEDVE